MATFREKRGRVRASYRSVVRVRGTDRAGKPFDIQGESTDYSRKGLGLFLETDVVSTGAVVSVQMSGRLCAGAVVQWVRCEGSGGRVRIGLRLVKARASLQFRVTGCILIFLAALSQSAAGKTRWGFGRTSSLTRCKVSAQQMKTIIDSALAQPEMITNEERAFVRRQHEQKSCEEYTRLFEQTTYYKSPGKREAMSKWHWEIYHSHGESVRDTPAHDAGTSVGSGR